MSSFVHGCEKPDKDRGAALGPRKLQRVRPKLAARSVPVFRTKAFASRAASRAARPIGTGPSEWGMFVYRLGIGRSGRAARSATRAFFPPCLGLGRPDRRAAHGPVDRGILTGRALSNFRARTLRPSVIRKSQPALPLLLPLHLRNAMATVRLDVVNSLVGERHPLADIDEFSGRLRAMKDKVAEDLVLVVRIEALIGGHGMDEAVLRAHAYGDAGAAAMMIYSRKSTADEIFSFVSG